jgi:hypothetical protein
VVLGSSPGVALPRDAVRLPAKGQALLEVASEVVLGSVVVGAGRGSAGCAHRGWVCFAAGDLLLLSVVGVAGICAREVCVTRFATSAGAVVSRLPSPFFTQCPFDREARRRARSPLLLLPPPLWIPSDPRRR